MVWVEVGMIVGRHGCGWSAVIIISFGLFWVKYHSVWFRYDGVGDRDGSAVRLHESRVLGTIHSEFIGPGLVIEKRLALSKLWLGRRCDMGSMPANGTADSREEIQALNA